MAEKNWSNQTIWTGDNLDIMRGMNSESVDLIYLDPPFNSNANYAAPIGSEAAGAEFKDTWGLDDLKMAWHALIKTEHPALYYYLIAAKDIHSKSMMAYLIYMTVRVMEMHRILKPTGSIYLHCDQYASHYLKLMLDTVFGKSNFRNEIIWHYKTGGTSKKWFSRKHDVIFLYSKTEKYRFNHNKEKSYLTHKYGFKNIEIDKDSKGVFRYVGIRDVWEIPALRGNQPEQVGYPTQKPLELLRRIISASTENGDTVLDPFCGCATTCVAADELQCEWVGIDVSARAYELVNLRLRKKIGVFDKSIHRTDVPVRTDLGTVKRYNHPENKDKLYGVQRGRCSGCKEHFQHRHLEIDHIIPRSKGGQDNLDNLQLLCGSCNRIKGNRSQEYLISVLNDRELIKL